MTVGAYPLRAPLERLPALFSAAPLDPATALGRLFAADWVDRGAEETAELLGEWRPALALLPEREQRRVALVTLWISALARTAREGDRVERKLERLNRSAFLVAKALAGEPTASPFAALFAAESAARLLPRRALDLLLAEVRGALERPRPADLEEWRARARALGGATAEALLGQEPTAATVDAAAALLRLALLARLPSAIEAGRSHLPLAPEDALSTAPRDERERSPAAAAFVAAEVEDVRAQLLRGARALAEVPLGYRRALAYLVAMALDLVGRIEDRPEEILRRVPQPGWWRRRLYYWRARRTPI